MKKLFTIGILALCFTTLLCGCASAAQASGTVETLVSDAGAADMEYAYTVDTRITDVMNDPVFGSYGRLIFPANTGYYSGDTLGGLRLTWYSHIDPAKTVEIVNTMYLHAKAGDTIFYDIYTDEEKAADPAKKDTGLFFFKGTPGERFAICNAGGGFAYVGAMHDSFPHALELSRMWIPPVTPSGAGPPDGGWRHTWAATARKRSAAMICPVLAQLSCSTRATASTRRAIRPHTPVWEPMTASQAGGRWSGGWML